MMRVLQVLGLYAVTLAGAYLVFALYYVVPGWFL